MGTASFNFDDQSSLFLPQKNKATVPGPVWLPMVVPTELITTGPESFGNFCSMRDATSFASSKQAELEM